MLKDPKEYAKMVMDCMHGDYKAAMVELIDFAKSDKKVPASYWADVVWELVELSRTNP